MTNSTDTSMSNLGTSKVIYERNHNINIEEEVSSGPEEPVEEWASLELSVVKENPKKLLELQGLYSPGSGEICTKEIEISRSSVLGHPYYTYPAVVDPGIKLALLSPIPPVNYSDDGRDLYKTVCHETNTCIVNLFYKNLLNNEINISYYGVSSKGIRAMALALQYNKHVKIFNLTENFLDDDACYHLGQLFRTNVTIEQLIVSGCRIGTSGLRRLIKHFHINRKLIALDLARNRLSDEDGVMLAEKMDEGGTIYRLNLSKNYLGMKTALALTETFEYRNILTHLDLSWNHFFNVPSSVKLLEKLALSEVLEELNLSWNSLEGNKVAKALRNITLVPTLQKLIVSNNRLKDSDIAIVVEQLMKAKHLRTLDLSYNPISPVGAYAVIQKMLRPRVKIENLFMESICVNKTFMQCLERVQHMKTRKNFVITHGKLVDNWVVQGSDARTLVLQRAAYLGSMMKHPIDVPLYLLKLSIEYVTPVDVKELIKRIHSNHIPLDSDLITEMANAFPGKKTNKSVSINLQKVQEYIHRLWPEKSLAAAEKMKIHHRKR